MKKMYSVSLGLAVAGMLFVSSLAGAAEQRGHDHDRFHGHDHFVAEHVGHAKRHAKNIIFMVPDGMGLADVTAARIAKNGPNGDRLSFEKLPVIGYQSTHSANSTVTDSAAAGSAWAAGAKFNNGEISCHSVDAVCVDNPTTILEVAESLGKSTGLVATSTITHATPAVFGAHVNSRKCEAEIARQYVEDTDVDVLLGGGFGSNNTSSKYNCSQYPGQDKDAVLNAALAEGYAYATTKDEMDTAVANGNTKILGLFSSSGLTPEYLRTPETTEPRLPEMAAAALNVLEKDKDGFFLMVEGSQIDWADHANNFPYQLGETLAFDEAVQTVLDWVNADEVRKRNTLVIVVPDHETGGFAINGPYGTLSAAGDSIEPGWTTNHHTAVDTIIWSQGPGSRNLGKALDNTDIYEVMVNAIR